MGQAHSRHGDETLAHGLGCYVCRIGQPLLAFREPSSETVRDSLLCYSIKQNSHSN
jgi:hypothetical protein